MMKKRGKYEKTPQAQAKARAEKTILQTYVTSLISLVLCVTMFFGTSFAWFTSEVTNTENEIYIGTLDVGLFKQTDAGAVSLADNNEKLFDSNIRWEPGYTALETIQIVNEGDLAFNYVLNFIETPADETATQAENETTTENENADELDIMAVAQFFDVWVYKHTETGAPDAKSYADIAAENSGWKSVGPLNELLAGNAVLSGTMSDVRYQQTAEAAEGAEDSTENSTEPTNKTDDGKPSEVTYTIALHMKESADSSVMGHKITLNVKLMAYQLASETDGFGNGSYDNVTAVTTAADLADAIQAGGHILLCNDVVLNGRLDIPGGVDVYLDMNGKEIQVTEESNVDYVFIIREGSTLTIGGDGTVETATPATILFYPAGNLIIEDGTYVRNVSEGYDGAFNSMFVGTKPEGGWESTGVEIYGGYFDSGYYDKNAADIEDLLTGAKTLEETDDDIAKRGAPGDKNVVRVALKNNTSKLLNRSDNYFKIYGGTFVGANPAWGDEGCMLPTNPNYLRPWSYYQGAFLEGQEFHEDGIVLPEGFSITKGQTEDGRPTYTVNYSK